MDPFLYCYSDRQTGDVIQRIDLESSPEPLWVNLGPASSKPAPIDEYQRAQHTPNFQHCGYLDKFIITDLLKQSVKLAVDALRNAKFDAIAFRGMSGALIAPPVALALNKTMLMVRKENDDSHALTGIFCYGRHVEGDYGARTYIILDDFTASGNTCRKIVEEIKKVAPQAKCLGMLPVRDLSEDKVALCNGRHKLTTFFL